MTEFEKGNKVKIVNTETVWDGKLGTVIAQADEEIRNENGEDLTEVLVRVAFKSSDGETKSINQTFNRGNLELVPEESLNEGKQNMEILDYAERSWRLGEILSAMNNEEAYYGGWLYIWPDGCTREECDSYFGDKESYEELWDSFKRHYKAYHKDGLYTSNSEIVNWAHEIDNELGLEPIKNLKEIKVNEEKQDMPTKLNKNAIWEELQDMEDETIAETLTEEYVDPKDDFIKPYVTDEDCDGKKIPGWAFVDRICAAEGCDDVAVVQCAQKNKYKLFYIEAGEYNKQIVAAKEIKVENIAEDFGDYLLGTARIEEIK